MEFGARVNAVSPYHSCPFKHLKYESQLPFSGKKRMSFAIFLGGLWLPH